MPDGFVRAVNCVTAADMRAGSARRMIIDRSARRAFKNSARLMPVNVKSVAGLRSTVETAEQWPT
jgi:hypothetical protein